MTNPTLSPITRREFWLIVAGMFSLVVGCSRQQRVTKTPQENISSFESRSITHALGTTRVPKVPQRIIALTGIAELEALLVLGVKPFAAAGDDRAFGSMVWQPHLEDQMQGVEMLPSRRNISLEKVATLQPDLIIGSSAPLKAVYPQLSQIAPTIAINVIRPWQENLRLVAEVVGEPERAETWIMAFEQRLATLADTYRETVAGITYTTAYYQPDRRQFNMIAGGDLDQVFKKIGLARPPEQTRMVAQQESGHSANISLERLDLIDTDLLFFYNYEYPTIQKAHELPKLNRFLEAEPLLRGLRAVENRRVFIVPAYYWFLGRSMGIPMAVDDLETIVLPFIT